MSDHVHPGETSVGTAVLDGAVAPYPRNRLYVKIAIVLAVITGAEVMTHVVPDAFGGMGSPTFVTALLVMMFAKFWAVAYFFMHLKWDNKILTWAFYSGFIVAGAVYLAVLAMMHVFSN